MTDHFRPKRRSRRFRGPAAWGCRPGSVAVAALLLAVVLTVPGGAASAPADNAAAVSAPADNAAAAPAPPAEAAAPAPATGTVREILVTKTPHYTNIEVGVDGKVGSYDSFKLSDPFRIVLDVQGVAPGAAAPEVAVDTPQVRTVRVSAQEGRLRILVETPEDRPFPYIVNAEEGRIVLSVGGGTEEKVTSLDRPEEKKTPATSPAVIGIDLEDLPETVNVVVTLHGDGEHKVVEGAKKGSLTLAFPGAGAEKGLLRALEAAKMAGPVKRVVPKAAKGGTEVAILFDPQSTVQVERRGSAVVASFSKKPNGGKAAVVAEVRERKPGVPGAAEAPAEAAPRAAEAAPEERSWGFLSRGGSEPKKYRGQRISLDFKDADLTNVFRIIAEVSNLNIITTDDVKGRVSLRLVNVPWDQALDIVLQSKGLGARQEGNILRIAPLSTLRSEEKARLDGIREVEKMQASVDGIVETIPINYSKASDLQSKVKELLSEGGRVQIDDRTNTLVLRDLRRNVEEIKSLVRTLDTPIPQVLIEARIVEVDTSYTRELGVQWGGIKQGTVDGAVYGVSGTQDAGGTFLSGLPVSNTPNPLQTANYAVNLPAAVGVGSGGGIAFGIVNNSFRLDLVLTALEASGKGKVISSPRVVTIDNKEALIEQGTQIPYSTVSASGTNTQFVDATLSLKVTPHITPEGSVIMKVDAKNDSQGATGATGQPAINKKKATTEVLVRDGETAVIGGILQISRNENESGVPWLSKIPVLGYFFKKTTTSTSNRELLIFITPKVLKPEPQTAKAS